MKYTYEQFKKYIEDNGVTDARTTEDWKDIPKGTLIKFGLYDGLVSSFEHHLQGQKQYKYAFDVGWCESWGGYCKGGFEVEEQKELRISVKTQEEWNAVVKKMLDDPKIGEWWNGNKNINEQYFKEYDDGVAVLYSEKVDNYKIMCSCVQWYEDNRFNIPLQSAQEYLGYDPNMGQCKPTQTFAFTMELNTINQLTKPKGNKYMSIISNAFKSKKNKALEYFNLGTTETLSERGRQEFIDFLWETLKEEKKAFLNKIVEAYKENKE